MMEALRDGIFCVYPETVDANFSSKLLHDLKSKNPCDLILDFSQNTPLKKGCLKPIQDFQEQQSRVLVLIVDSDHVTADEDWIMVPTQTEALDYISFEQMQRDLGT